MGSRREIENEQLTVRSRNMRGSDKRERSLYGGKKWDIKKDWQFILIF